MTPTYGVFAVDPGGSSGVAWGRLRDEGTVAERFAAMPSEWSGSVTVKDASWMTQARLISLRWINFRMACSKAGLPAYFVCEDFLLRSMVSSDREALYPVWIAAAIVGYRNGLLDGYELAGFGRSAPIEVVWQEASSAMTYATNERMKRWNLYLPGKPHENDAWRHLAYFVANKKSQNLRLARTRSRLRTHEANH